MDTDRLIRWLRWASVVLMLVGAFLIMSALAMPLKVPTFILPIGVLAMIGSFLAWAVVLLDRIWRGLTGRPAQSRSMLAPPSYTCPKCGYLLRGVKGVFCPECGTVRPAPCDGEDAA
jgi:hypothetical protein